MNAMTRQQNQAILNPCLLASETIHPRFCTVHHHPIRHSVILTINSGYE